MLRIIICTFIIHACYAVNLLRDRYSVASYYRLGQQTTQRNAYLDEDVRLRLCPVRLPLDIMRQKNMDDQRQQGQLPPGNSTHQHRAALCNNWHKTKSLAYPKSTEHPATCVLFVCCNR